MVNYHTRAAAALPRHAAEPAAEAGLLDLFNCLIF